MKNVKIKDIASKNIISLNEDSTLFEAVNLLTSARIHNLVITSTNKKHTILSINDILDHTQTNVWKNLSIATIARKELDTISQEASSLEASVLLKDKNDILGVVNDNNELIGVVSYANITSVTELDLEDISDISMFSIVSKNSAATVDKDSSFKLSLESLKTSMTDCIIVLDNNKPVGIITKRDYIRFITNDIDLNVPAGSLMSTPLFIVKGGINIYAALTLMQEKHYRRVIVVGADENILGVVTQKAIINIIYTRMVRIDCISKNKMASLLEAEVKERTKELENHREHLEQIIKERTKELEEANIKLNEKYINEQQMSKQKDKIMFHQSKQASMGEMLGMIAHQWRQPLASISYTYSLLKVKLSSGNLDKKLFETKLDEINKHTQYMSQTIDDFSNFYKPNKDKEEFLLKKSIESSLDILSMAISKNGIEIIQDYEELPAIFSYKNEIMQVILNILKNSIDIFEEGQTANPKIFISINSTQSHTQEIQIRDNNGGIAESIIDSIFDPYFSTKEEKNGTGLGLYMAKMIIEKHCGGMIKAQNSEDGAEFIVTL